MNKLYLFISIFLPIQIWALGASNGFIPKPQGKVTAQEQRAILKTLDHAECIYGNLGDGIFRKEWDPEIFDAPDECSKKNSTHLRQKSLCVGTVVCHSSLLNFVVEKATCWSNDGQTCPPPSKCAQQSFILSFQMVKAMTEMPVYITTEPARTIK
jgi:hypothetical protein